MDGVVDSRVLHMCLKGKVHIPDEGCPDTALEVSRIYIGSANVNGDQYAINAWGFAFRRSKDDTSPVTLGDLVGDKIIYRIEMESEDDTISPFVLGFSAGFDIMSHPELLNTIYSTSIYFSCNKDMTKQGAGTPCDFYAICLSIV